MITTTIVKKKTENNPVPERLGKLAYSVYLSGLKIKKGDIVVNKYILDGNHPVKPTSLFVVDDIQEIHLMVEYEDDSPKCLFLRNCNGVSFWNIPNRWVVASDETLKAAGVDKSTFEWTHLC